jgi:hypothetical protein
VIEVSVTTAVINPSSKFEGEAVLATRTLVPTVNAPVEDTEKTVEPVPIAVLVVEVTPK